MAQPPMPPPQPLAFPEATQLKYIDGAFLTDPLVTTAYDYVVKTVRPELLNLRPSIQNSFGNVTYPATQAPETAFCHWGIETQCVRRTATNDFKADILTCPGAGQWGLTYDDGPNTQTTPGTPQLRAALKTANLKATFFVLGASVTLAPAELKATYDDGHQIAIHTWTHHPLTNLTNQQIVAEVKYTERLIYNTIGVLPTYVRPPYGDIDDRVRAILNALGYRIVIWTTFPDIVRDSQDTITAYQQAGIPAMVQNITKWFNDPATTTRGFISLEHDISNFTAGLSIAVVDAFRTATTNLKPMPVAQCIGEPAYRGTNTTTTAAGAVTGTPFAVTQAGTTPSATTTTKPNGSNANTVSKVLTFSAVLMGVLLSIL
ncbi:chitin deacetylase [Nowakowskiella sp. JEL0407]|nr:chitin deacetylase [Nowakowskiella sp. JEL0407]